MAGAGLPRVPRAPRASGVPSCFPVHCATKVVRRGRPEPSTPTSGFSKRHGQPSPAARPCQATGRRGEPGGQQLSTRAHGRLRVTPGRPGGRLRTRNVLRPEESLKQPAESTVPLHTYNFACLPH